MVYKRYIKRGGKRFGPYYYESYRDSSGKVVSRFVSGPKPNSSDRSKSLRIFGVLLFAAVLLVTLLLLIGNLSYFSKVHTSTTGKVVDSSPTFSEMQVAEQIADKSLFSNVDVRKVVNLEVKDVSQENNKIIEFSTPNGKIELNFDLLNYSEFVKNKTFERVDSSNFDVEVNSSPEKYKWGYNVELADLNFIAKIDVLTNQSISVIDNQTIKIGDAYLSFADLSSQGYTLSIGEPDYLNASVVNESILVNESIILNETNVSEINLTNYSEINITNITLVTNISFDNESETNMSNVSITLNETLENITVQNESEGVENISNENKTDLDVVVGNETDSVVVNESIPNEDPAEIIPQENDTDASPESSAEQTPAENTDITKTPVSDEIPTEETPETSQPTATEEAISSISGFVVRGFRGLTGNVIFNENSNPESKVSIFVQRDFSGTNYTVGDTVNLDPTLIYTQSDDGNIINVSACGTLSTPNTYYRLNQSISSATSCITISANNITLDGNGFNITSGTGSGISSTGYNNLTIKNLNINGRGSAILILNSNYSIAQNNNITTNGSSGYGIRNENGNYLNANNNHIITYGVTSAGIDLGANSNISFNTILTLNNSDYGTNSHGIYRCVNSTIYGNNITAIGTNSYGIFLNNGCNITLNTIYTNGVGSSQALSNSQNSIISFNNITANRSNTIASIYSNNVLYSNNFYGTVGGLSISSNDVVYSNNIITGTYGISIGSVNNTVYSNNVSGIYISAGGSNNNISNNIINTTNLNRISIIPYITYDDYDCYEGCYSYTFNNIFTNNTMINRNYSYYDLLIYSSSSPNSKLGANGTTFIDQYFENYNITIPSKINIIDSNFGKISFLNAVNGTGANFSDDIKITNNSVYVNSSQAGLNKSANVTLYNLPTDFLAPFIFYNGTNFCNTTTSPVCYNFTSLNSGNVTFNVSIWSNYTISSIVLDFNSLTSCGTINSSGSYILNQNLVGAQIPTPGCFNITTSNVTLDCQGHYIFNNSVEGAGIYAGNESGLTNITIKNCNISIGSLGYGIQFNNVNNSAIINNTLDSNDYGIHFYLSGNNTLSSNIIRSNTVGIFLSISQDNLFKDSVILNTSQNDTFVTWNSTNNIFLNVSYDSLKEFVNSTPASYCSGGFLLSCSEYTNQVDCESGFLCDWHSSDYSPSQIIRKWYYLAYVNDSLGNPVSSANFSIYNSSNSVELNTLTNSSGWTSTSSIIEYINDGLDITYSTPHLIHSAKSGAGISNKNLNISLFHNTLNDTLTLGTNLSSCAVIDTSGVYTLTSNITPEQGYSWGCFNIDTSNVVLDCNNHYINLNAIGHCTIIIDFCFSGTRGIYAGNDNGITNITVKNCNVAVGFEGGTFGTGILFSNVNNSLILNNTPNSNWNGIYIDSGSNNKIINNTASSNLQGIFLYSSYNNTLLSNDVSSNSYESGITLDSSTNNQILNNTINSNLYHGISLSFNSNNNQIINNTLNSNEKGISLYSNLNNSLSFNRLNLNGEGIEISESSNNFLLNNTLSFNDIGIRLSSSSYNVLTNLTVHHSRGSDGRAILLEYSSNNNLTKLTLNSNPIPIMLAQSSSNFFLNNAIWNCSTSSNNAGCIYLATSQNNTFSGGIVNLSSKNLVYIETNSSNNLFRDLTLVNGSKNDTFLSSVSLNNTFLNVTYNNSKEYVENGSTLIRKWYYSLYVNDTLGNPVNLASVNIINSSNTAELSTLTNSSGRIGSVFILEYSNYGNSSTGVNRTYATPQVIYASKAGTGVGSSRYNLSLASNVLNDTITLSNNLSSCSVIDAPGVYTLSRNLIGAQIPEIGCFNITVSNVTLDCQNHYILNTSVNASGIYAGSQNGLVNITIRNCNVSMKPYDYNNGGYGIYFNAVNNSALLNNLVNSNYYGIFLNSSSKNQIINNTANLNQLFGFYIISSSHNLIANNSVIPTEYGIFLLDGINETLTRNNVSNGFVSGMSGSRGIYLQNIDNSLVIDNIANYNLGDSFGAGIGIYLQSSSNNLVINNTAKFNQGGGADNFLWGIPYGAGIYLNEGSNNQFINNTADSNREGSGLSDAEGYGLYISGTNSSVYNNSANYNSHKGILVSGTNSSVYNNSANYNGDSGMVISGLNILTSNNILRSNHIGITISGTNNTISDNYIWNCTGNYSCVYFLSASNNTLSRGIVNLSSSNLFYFSISKDNLIMDLNATLGTKNDTFLTENSSNNIFLNVSYNSSKEYVDGISSDGSCHGSLFGSCNSYTNQGDCESNGCTWYAYFYNQSSLVRKWYYQAYVNDSFGNPVSSANVSGYDNSNLLIFNSLTNSSGSINLTELTEYINHGSNITGVNITYATAHAIYASKAGTGVGSSLQNLSLVSNVLNDTITLGYNLSSCSRIDIPGNYTLSQSIFSPQPVCFNISSSNVIFDCRGHFLDTLLTGSDIGILGVYAGSESGLRNITIKNCNISMGNPTGDGILFYNVNNSYIVNNPLGSNSNVISLAYSSNNTIFNNSFSFFTSTSVVLNNLSLYNNIYDNQIRGGVGFITSSNSSNNYLINNNISSMGGFFIFSNNNQIINNSLSSSIYGIMMISNNTTVRDNNLSSVGAGFSVAGSNNTFINNLIWNCSAYEDASTACIYLSRMSQNNLFFGGIVNLSGNNLIDISNESSNNIFRDITLLNAENKDLNLTIDSVNNTFLNVSYNSSKEYVEAGSSLVRSWYYQAYVNHTGGGAVNNANLYAANSSGNYVFNTTTNSSGWIPIQALTQYINNGTLNYVDIYMINATNITDSDGHYYNVSEYNGNNFFDSFTVNDTTVPFSYGLINSYACEGNYFSLYFNVTDLGLDLPVAELSPTDPFYSELISIVNLTSSEQRIFSGVLTKSAAGGANNRSKTHNLTVSLYDGVNTNSSHINITVIETNEQPSMENFDSSYTVYSGDTFYHQVLVNDSEDGNESSGRLYFNMTITGGNNITDINASGALNFVTNSSILGTYTFEVCATDKGLSNPSPNISLCSNGAGNKTECKSFVLNIVERTNDGGSGGNRGGGGGGGGGGSDNSLKNKSNEDSSDYDTIDVNIQSENPNNNSFSCGDWSKCNTVYGITEIIEGMVFLRGEKIRSCLNLNTGLYETQRKQCTAEINVTVKKSNDCYSDGLVVLDENSNLLSRVQYLAGEKNQLNIQFFIEKSSYCPYCYDHVKDYDETGIDCGGSCGLCVEHPIRVYSNFTEILFFIVLVGVLVCINIIALLALKYYNLKSVLSVVKKEG